MSAMNFRTTGHQGAFYSQLKTKVNLKNSQVLIVPVILNYHAGGFYGYVASQKAVYTFIHGPFLEIHALFKN